MNTLISRNTRRIAAATLLLSVLAASAPASARPTDPGWFGPPEVKDRPGCGAVWTPARHGPAIAGPKAVWVVRRELAPCPPSGERPVLRYAGPRGTVPIRE